MTDENTQEVKQEDTEAKAANPVEEAEKIIQDSGEQKKLLDELLERSKGLEKSLADNLDKSKGLISENPLLAVGIAGGVGLILGAILGKSGK